MPRRITECADASGPTTGSSRTGRLQPGVGGINYSSTNSSHTSDCYGHGTHVAGIIGGRTYAGVRTAAHDLAKVPTLLLGGRTGD